MANITWWNLSEVREWLKSWTLAHAGSLKAKWLLATVSFSEASFFLVPPDVVLIAILIVLPMRWVYYAGLTTITSVLGGVFGYVVGYFFFATIGNWIIGLYGLHDEFLYVETLFADHAFWSIFISAFTPIPFKVFTLSAGFFQINFGVFVLASLFGRAMRFFVVAYIIHRFGASVGRAIYRYFNLAALIGVGVLVLLILYFYLT